MIDRVDSKCHECGEMFATWLGRGEIAPALCIGCWWRGSGQNEAELPDNGPTVNDELKWLKQGITKKRSK